MQKSTSRVNWNPLSLRGNIYICKIFVSAVSVFLWVSTVAKTMFSRQYRLANVTLVREIFLQFTDLPPSHIRYLPHPHLQQVIGVIVYRFCREESIINSIYYLKKKKLSVGLFHIVHKKYRANKPTHIFIVNIIFNPIGS